MMKKVSVLTVFAFLLLTFTAFAKYCPDCGKYNDDGVKFCTKCGCKFAVKNPEKVGVFVSVSMHPHEKGKFTVYYKAKTTPFIVNNPDAETEIGEVTLPKLDNYAFVAMKESKQPDIGDMKKMGKKYNVDKILLIDFSTKKTERVPIFSSQKYMMFLDAETYSARTGEMIQKKRYENEMQAWPDITLSQIKSQCQGLWDQMTPNLKILLTK